MTAWYIAAAVLSLLSLAALLPSCLAPAATPRKPARSAAHRTVPRYRRGAVVIGA